MVTPWFSTFFYISPFQTSDIFASLPHKLQEDKSRGEHYKNEKTSQKNEQR